MALRIFIFTSAISVLCCAFIQAQCLESFGSIYGTTDSNERGTCLVATPDNSAMYVTGTKDDSLLLLKVDLLGEILWAKTIDVVPGLEEYPTGIIVDSEGRIAIVGISGDNVEGGSIFVIRYNPDNHQIEWAKEYVTNTIYNFSSAILQKGSGGNYIITNNPHWYPGDNLEILELNKNTGLIMPGLSKQFILSTSSEALSQIVYHENFIYGVGRYTDGVAPEDMRNTLVKLDPNTGTHIWTRMGHIGPNPNARLYGAYMVIDQNEIVSGYHGDPVSTSTSNTKLYIQRTSLDGNLIWLKQYELPGNNDVCFGLIKSGNGFVVLAGKGSPSGKVMLYKINADGSLAWGKSFQFPSIITSVTPIRGLSKLIEVGGKLAFTAQGNNSSGGFDMILVITDLNGNVDNPCVESQDIAIPVLTISNPVFYSVNMSEILVTPDVNAEFPEVISSELPPRDECTIVDTVYSFVQASICEGEEYEGYSIEGTYEDVFTSSEGCDSIRTLALEVNNSNWTMEQIQICLGQTYAGESESGVYVDTFQNILGCDSMHTLILEVIPLEAFENFQICDGEEYEGYEVSGMYVDTLEGVGNSCDTVRYLDLTVNPPEETLIFVTICDGESYEGYSSSGVYEDIFQNIEGCDSIRTLELNVEEEEYTEEEITICLGEAYQGYSESGTYVNTYQNVLGCDSIHTLILEVEALEIDLIITICEGEEYDGYTTEGFYIDTLQGPVFSCDTVRYLELNVNDPVETFVTGSICSGNNYEGYTTTGVYVDQFINIYGCDSIRTLDLTVANEIFTEIQIEICPGQTYEGYSDEGTYVDEFTTPSGCDSIRTLELSIGLPEISLDILLCAGGEFEGYSEEGNYVDILPGESGECDTTRNLTISFLDPVETSIDLNICSGENYMGHTSTGIYIDTLQTEEGCDSIRTVNLLVTDEILTSENKIMCPGDIYQGYTNAGIYQDTFLSAAGCDSIRTLDLTVSNVILQEISMEICPGQSYEGYVTEGVYLDTFITAFGCDSIRTLNLSVEMPASFVEIAICEGEEFEGYSQGGFYVDTIQGSSNACDTVRHLLLTVSLPNETLIQRTICNGDSYLGYSATGIYVDTFLTMEGCDSIRILDLIVATEIITNEIVEICLGDNYQGYTIAGIYIDTLQAVIGCDSIINLQLNVVPVDKMLDIQICSGDTFENYSSSGFYIDTLPGIFVPCDTVRYLSLTVHPAVHTMLEKAICEGENYYGYTLPGIYTDTLKTAEGCDSVRTVALTTVDEVFSHYTTSVCEGISFGHSKPGTYVDTLISFAGCDSIVTFIVKGSVAYIPNVFSPNDDGINDLFTVFQFPEKTLDLEYFAIFDRFGDMTYQTSVWPIQWDGKRLDGEPYQPAVFAYVFIYLCGDARTVEHGNITIIK